MKNKKRLHSEFDGFRHHSLNEIGHNCEKTGKAITVMEKNQIK